MDLDLTGRHALVCGASEGIGAAAAHELALLGAEVTVLARRGDVLAEVSDALPRPSNQRHRHLAVDMDDTAGLAQAVAALVREHPVHILVNNTAGPPGGPAADADDDAYLGTFRRHLIGGQTMLRLVLPAMKEAGFGRLVNVISTSVKEPIPNLGVSNTVRGAVAAWAKTLASELAPHGITVNNVLPGFTDTGRLSSLIKANAAKSGTSEQDVAAGMLSTVPAGRFARAGETAAAIAFLCSPAAAFINGVNLPVDGGRTRSL
ncbi:SDR family oxidoreductase [Alkalisalibacterium limincola]|uniref:SDR family oxidoreductase n=1 Tax=Alkalisalibacterium limincola TaxID=2699169 RepID=A0A5C8KX44_9GAMM|nr:SDR family oxidoreductase [Alkalisalibacterium limincola]TXK64394.1 SDR family oxidoreductase [Alkalisalibacterium limincola]